MPNGPPDIIDAYILFQENPEINRSKLIGNYSGVIVFPTTTLEQQIIEKKLLGQLLNVQLERRTTVNRLETGQDAYIYIAHPHPNKPLICQSADITNPSDSSTKQRRVILIDGQNFLGAWRISSVSNIDPDKILRKIIDQYQALEAQFFICWESALSLRYVTDLQKQQIEAIDGLQIIDRPMKVVQTSNLYNNGEKHKVDIDHLLTAVAVELQLTRPDVEGMVLIAGDGDYLDICQRWLGLEEYAHFGHRKVDVISTLSTLSRELRGLVQEQPLAQLQLFDQTSY